MAAHTFTSSDFIFPQIQFTDSFYSSSPCSLNQKLHHAVLPTYPPCNRCLTLYTLLDCLVLDFFKFYASCTNNNLIIHTYYCKIHSLIKLSKKHILIFFFADCIKLVFVLKILQKVCHIAGLSKVLWSETYFQK